MPCRYVDFALNTMLQHEHMDIWYKKCKTAEPCATYGLVLYYFRTVLLTKAIYIPIAWYKVMFYWEIKNGESNPLSEY
jgi:hypothetical protein